MESVQNTRLLKPASLYSKNPRERFEARRMEGDCKGHSPATRSAMAWLIAANAPDMRASNLLTLPDEMLWEGAKAAHKANPSTLHTLPDSILQSIAWGEAVALLWGLRCQTFALPTGDYVFDIINAASPGVGTTLQEFAFEDDLPPFNELRWRMQSFIEDPFKPTFKSGFCLPWWPEQYKT